MLMLFETLQGTSNIFRCLTAQLIMPFRPGHAFWQHDGSIRFQFYAHATLLPLWTFSVFQKGRLVASGKTSVELEWIFWRPTLLGIDARAVDSANPLLVISVSFRDWNEKIPELSANWRELLTMVQSLSDRTQGLYSGNVAFWEDSALEHSTKVACDTFGKSNQQAWGKKT